MKPKIGVLAGTPVDTQFGVRLAQSSGWETVPVAVSRTPQEQTAWQVQPEAVKQEALFQLLAPIKKQGVQQVLVYCNSLSASVDFESLAFRTGLSFCTPFQYYAAMARDYRRLALLAANAQGAAGVEAALVSAHEELSVVSVGNLRWVEAIERQEDPAEIVRHYGFPELLRTFDAMECEAIVLGCTHFPYLENALRTVNTLPVLQPDDYFRTWLKEV